jgi:hypothetical protein
MRVKLTNWKKISASTLVIGAIFALLSLQTRAATQSDAIAVRIMPNTNHDSIETWYASQGFKGSPQSLIVDGYEAIRDGRTVFVNAANLDTTNKKIYTNIYLISYNQESEEKTLDILGQLVSHWKFNDNVVGSGYCSISNVSCQADADCASDYICSNAEVSSAHSAFDKGKCVLKNEKVCNIDSDCPVNLFCDSLKALSIRDIKRLGDLNQANKAIDSFKISNGTYPSLQSGTYVSGASLSVWPSWKETLWSQLGLSQLLIDPINALGYCAGYDAKTCWNNTTNAFINSDLVLPAGSHAFIYKSISNGLNYILCSVFETKNLGYDTLDKKISTNNCAVDNNYTGASSNTAPSISSYYINGEAGKIFNGYIKAKDTEGDLISWKLSVDSPTPWLNGGWSSGSSLIPVLQDTGDPNQKKLYAPKAGNSGTYEINLTLTDSRGAATTTKLNIVISDANKPKIEASDINYFVDPVNPLKYTFSVEGSNSKPTYTFVPLNSALTSLNAIVTNALTSASVTSVGLNKNKIDFSVLIPVTTKVTQDVSVPFVITAKADGATASTNVNFNFKVEKPYLNFECENMARIGKPYQISGTSCLLGKTTSGNHSFNYSILSGPAGLKINSSGYRDGFASLSADTIAVPAPTSTEVKIAVTNEYGASTEKSFNLKVNSFCGDGIKQQPNSEGRGGFNNDGVEACDGEEGISRSISISSDKQYGCTSGLTIKSPYPILDNNSCVFKQADNGGGYCGDDICQFKIDNSNMENCWNCRQDCGTCLATLESSADAEHVAYYDSKFLYKSISSSSLATTSVTLVPGKNVFAFWAQDLNDTNYGLSFKVKTSASSTIFQEFSTKAPLPVGSNLVCTFVPRASALNVKSADDYNPADGQSSFLNWTTSGYNDSAWSQIFVNPKKDIFNGVPYIWPTGSHGPNNSYGAGAAVYCRLTFDYKPYNMDTCIPNCTNRTCGSDGCGGTCGTCGTDSFCSLHNYQCQLKCGSRKCGPNTYDGASCGTCSDNGICLDGQCPSPSTNIQVCADNSHNSFFNGNHIDTGGKIMTGSDWKNIEHFTVKLADKNIFAIQAVDWGGIHGVSATLNIEIAEVKRFSLNTGSSNEWKCNREATTGWTTDWDADNSWSTSVSMNNPTKTSGNALASSTNSSAGISQIWLKDPNCATSNICTTFPPTSTFTFDTNPVTYLTQKWTSNAYCKTANQCYPSDTSAFSGVTYDSGTKTVTNPDYIYCRYKFDISSLSIPCTPNCTNKCGGFDGCSDYCDSACPGGQVCGGDPAKLNECAVKK